MMNAILSPKDILDAKLHFNKIGYLEEQAKSDCIFNVCKQINDI